MSEPSAPCPHCRRSNTWFQPACQWCGLNLWTNTFEPLEEFFARRFPVPVVWAEPVDKYV